ncbi:Xenobiotic-transporting ATPase [Methanobacterium lacus]|uniref:Xenobiotic-transporting ATPase n=2 Tax=Methanobacterium lacus (strain AL-21) TaxID=877455 RepID=F0TBM4_METLA|nr:Xenobiotic-transporting ATPase [Methanobacterium lacus]
MIRRICNDFKYSLMGRYTADLIKSMPKKIIISIVLMVTISLLQGISLLMLIPLLQLVGLNVSDGSIGQIASIVSNFFVLVHIQPTLPLVLLIYVLIISSIAALNRIQLIQSSFIAYQFSAQLRKRLYIAITKSNWLFFSKNKSSNFTHALTNEIERISMGTTQFLALLASIMILVVYIIFALKIAGLLTGIIFLIGVVILLILRRRVLKSRETGENITYTTKDLYSSIIQHMDGMKTIKSFGMQDTNIEYFSIQTNKVASNYMDTIRSYADVKFIFDVGTVVVLSIMVLFLINILNLPMASLFLLIYIFVVMIPQFSTVQRSYQYSINSLPAYGNILKLEEECILNVDYEDSKKSHLKFEDCIYFENVSFAYESHKQYSVNDVNIKIPKGKTVAIIGPSGAGKSTVADILMGLIQPTKGKVSVDQNNIFDSKNSWRNHIGYVAQETFLFNETIKFNLLLSKLNATDYDIIIALKAAAAYEFVSKLPYGINTVIGDRGVKLSGGEKQRLAMARALLRKPYLLILDESTSNLDSKNEQKILKAIDDLHGKTTIFMIAHRFSTIKNADLIYLMDNSKILEFGTWEDLLKSKNKWFKEVYNTQMQYIE